MSAHPHDLSHCENCGVALHGAYCHACGQTVLSPVRHAGHAIEEVFEAFWHLDGRVFRTLRDLVFPGRVAINYLAGHRARYIAPLRLFVILSLLTFFVGKLVVHVDTDTVGLDGREAAIGRAQTIAEVKQIEGELLKELAVKEDAAAERGGTSVTLIAARAKIQGEAADRVVELKQAAARGTPPPRKFRHDQGDTIRFNDRPWDAKTNPVNVAWLPGFADRWLNYKIGKARDNLGRMDGNMDAFVQAFLGAVPTALFLLMPLFALLLKLFYLGSRRLYLEHLVVALYSHAWLLLALLASFLMSALNGAFAAPWLGITTSLAHVLLWLWTMVYLFLMQSRVYRQGRLLATLKYVVIGSTYFVLVSLAAGFALLAGIAS